MGMSMQIYLQWSNQQGEENPEGTPSLYTWTRQHELD